jgi:hypothetical protein
MADKSLRTAQRRLDQMFRAGWVRRFKITTRKQGKTRWTSSLGARLQARPGPRGPSGPFIDPQLKWQQPDVRDAAFVLHDLHAAASLFACRDRPAQVGERLAGLVGTSSRPTTWPSSSSATWPATRTSRLPTATTTWV